MDYLNKKKMKLKRSFFMFFGIFPVFFSPVLAQSDNSESPPPLSDLFLLIDRVIEFMFPFASFIAVVFIIMGGYMWISSSGDPAKIKQAQGTLTWAIVGLLFSLITPMILNLVFDLIGKGSQ